MRKYIFITVLVLSVFGLSLAFAASELKGLEVGSKDVIRKDYVEISSDELVDGKAQIKGVLTSPDKTAKVSVSLDAGASWQEAAGKSPFVFGFAPAEEEEYPVIIKGENAKGGIVFSKVVVLRYVSKDLRNEFDTMFEDIRQLYIGERLSKFLAHFDEDEYPNFTTFKANMEDTFDGSSNFNLNISIRQVSLMKDKDKVIVRVDWDKTFEDESRQSGTNNEIHFKRKEGIWKITYISDDIIFVIGTGTLGGSMTNN